MNAAITAGNVTAVQLTALEEFAAADHASDKGKAWTRANDNAFNVGHAGGAPGLATKVLTRVRVVASFVNQFRASQITDNLVDQS